MGDVETVLRLQDAVAGHARERIAQAARGVVSAMVAAGGFHRKGSKKRDSTDVAGQEAAMPFCDGRARYTGRFRFANIFFTSVDRADGRQAIVQCKKAADVSAKKGVRELVSASFPARLLKLHSIGAVVLALQPSLRADADCRPGGRRAGMRVVFRPSQGLASRKIPVAPKTLGLLCRGRPFSLVGGF